MPVGYNKNSVGGGISWAKTTWNACVKATERDTEASILTFMPIRHHFWMENLPYWIFIAIFNGFDFNEHIPAQQQWREIDTVKHSPMDLATEKNRPMPQIYPSSPPNHPHCLHHSICHLTKPHYLSSTIIADVSLNERYMFSSPNPELAGRVSWRINNTQK